MEHILQLGINIDDEAIRQAALKQASKDISEAVGSCIYAKDYYGRVRADDDSPLKGMVTKAIEQLVEDNKDKIIDSAIEQITEKAYKSKKFKEKFGELLNEKWNA